MSQTINNENEYRLARSKVLREQQQSSSSHQQQHSEHVGDKRPHLAAFGAGQQKAQPEGVSVSESGPDILPEAMKESSLPPDNVQSNTRSYLGDLSNQFGSSALKPQTSLGAVSHNSSKRVPLGGDNAPLQQRRQKNDIANPRDLKVVHTKTIETSSSTTNSTQLSMPSRMPQKRHATESSTNLVEKLHIQDTNASSSTESVSYKKSKKVDYEWQDLDEEDMDDPLMASEYVGDIFTYFSSLEKRMLPDADYLHKQKHLKPKMRSILVDWLVEMHLRFRLLPESLFLAINIMDRFMSIEEVPIDKLQLLATGSLFIASKYEEVISPSVKNYAYFTDGSYTEEEILQAEKFILTMLKFDLNYPNPMNFLRRISKADDYDVQSRTLGKFLLEITAIDYNFIGLPPSLCCASAMYLARLILEKSPVWNGNLIHYSGGYKIEHMKQCVNLIFQYLISPIEHDEFFKKYATRKFMRASVLCRSWAKKFHAENKDLFDQSLSTEGLTLDK